MNQGRIYQKEDIAVLYADMPPQFEASVIKLTYSMMDHEAYDNKE